MVYQTPSGAIKIAELLGVDEALLREMRAARKEIMATLRIDWEKVNWLEKLQGRSQRTSMPTPNNYHHHDRAFNLPPFWC